MVELVGLFLFVVDSFYFVSVKEANLVVDKVVSYIFTSAEELEVVVVVVVVVVEVDFFIVESFLSSIEESKLAVE